MGMWSDPEAWERLRGGATCPVCLRGGPTNVVAELEVSLLTAGEVAPLRGSCALFLERHAVELYELDPDEAAAYMRDLQRASRAVQEATGAIKMNYEIHGNTIPHLHTHLFPRYPGDPFEGRPIDSRNLTASVYGPGELAALFARVREALA
jgi:diadenosine tetraphosphate (Ap4A) HIT family hydrolase